MRRILFLLLTLASALTLSAQPTTPIDAPLQAFNARPDYQRANAFFDVLIAEQFDDGLKRYPAQTPTDTLCREVWYWAAEFYLDAQCYEQAVEYGEKALPLFKKANQLSGEADCLAAVTIAYVRLADYKKALPYAKRLCRIDRAQGDPSRIASSLNTLASVYMGANQPELAYDYSLQAISYAERANDSSRIAIFHGLASEICYRLRQHDKSLAHAQTALQMEQALNRPDKIAIRKAQMASSLIGLQRAAEAKPLLAEAIAAFRANGNLHSLAISCNQMGDILHDEQRDEEAVKYYEEALQIFLAQHDLYNESHSRYGLYQALRRIRPEEAMLHNDRFNQLRDSLYDSETGQLLSQYAAQYGNEQLQDENAQLRQSRWVIAVGIAAVTLLIVLCLYLIYRHRARRYRQRITELSKQVETIGHLQDAQQPAATANPAGADNWFLVQIVDTVKAAMPQRMPDVEYLAEQMQVSTSTLRRRIINLTGETPKAFITALQMQRAEELLQNEPTLTINQVAQQCGYDNTNNFTRTFKRIHGVTPSKYGRQQRTADELPDEAPE